MSAQITTADVTELSKQQTYADSLAKKGFDFGLAVGTAFVESMRNTYYKHTGTALDELIDNAIEAGAGNIHVAYGYYGKSDKKPDAIAVIDDGHGMPKNMARLSVLWGGTHREGSRTGFGRFGFGLPSASVNQGRRYSVFSLVEGQDWHGVTIDLDDIRDGKYTDPTGRVVAPDASVVAPPKWVLDYVNKNFANKALKHGTVVLLEKLDRLSWKTTSSLSKKLAEHFGVSYRNYIAQIRLVLDGERVEPSDPLFITPGYRHYDLDEDRAVALEPAEIWVKPREDGEKVPVRIRYARFPLSFYAIDKVKSAVAGNQNARFNITTENFGIIINRMGRQIHVVEQTPWAGLEKFRNDDRYWAAEIDFPAELDEEFSVSNSKQGVFLSDRMWELLKNAGMENALRSLRKAIVADQKLKVTIEDKPEEKRISEKSMEDADKFKARRTETESPERERKAKEALEQYARKKSRDTGAAIEQARKEAEEEAVKHPYRVEFESMPGAPFFRVEQIGGMKVLNINRAHRFYTDVYAGNGGNRHVRSALEILLFVIGDCELDAQGNPDRKTFYAVERQEWSQLLSAALEMFSRFVHDTEVVDAEELEDAAAQ
jgi:hypothetical protein